MTAKKKTLKPCVSNSDFETCVRKWRQGLVASQQETAKNERWEQGLGSPQQAEAQPVFATCFEMLRGGYLKCKVCLFKTNLTHRLRGGGFLAGALTASRRWGVPSPPPRLARQGPGTLPSCRGALWLSCPFAFTHL